MIFIDQTRLHDPEKGVNGNCLAACVATLLQVPISNIPEFENMGDDHFHKVIEFVASQGLRLTYHPGSHPPQGMSIGTVNSPRFPSLRHAVVCHNGRVIHDPHPTRASLEPERIWFYETFEPWEEKG